MHWGLAIKAYRKREGLSQEALAQQLGVDARQIRRWEAGGRLPNWVAEKIGLVRNVSTDEALCLLVDLCAKLAILVDKDGRVLRTSPRHQEVFGYDQKDLIGKPFLAVAPPAVGEFAQLMGGSANAVAQAMLKRGRFKTVRPAGDTFGLNHPVYAINDIYMINDDGVFRAMLSIGTEITEDEYNALPSGLH